jgi:outer membrane lipoprotein SlyB
MPTYHKFHSAAGLAALAVLTACGSTYPPNNSGTPSGTYYPPATGSTSPYLRYGVVQTIELVQQEASGIGAGTILGAVVGGIVGNQVGKGDGNTAATVIGAAGGAYAGNQIEKRNQQPDVYKVTVRMTDGTNLAVMQATSNDIRIGDRVVFDNGVLRRY